MLRIFLFATLSAAIGSAASAEIPALRPGIWSSTFTLTALSPPKASRYPPQEPPPECIIDGRARSSGKFMDMAPFKSTVTHMVVTGKDKLVIHTVEMAVYTESVESPWWGMESGNPWFTMRRGTSVWRGDFDRRIEMEHSTSFGTRSQGGTWSESRFSGTGIMQRTGDCPPGTPPGPISKIKSPDSDGTAEAK